MFYFIYIFSILFLCLSIYLIIKENKMNPDLLFLIFVNYLLNILTALYYGFYSNMLLTIISSFFLCFFASLLLFNIYKIMNKLLFFSLPYLFLFYLVFFYTII